jgi:hypothetical protein
MHAIVYASIGSMRFKLLIAYFRSVTMNTLYKDILIGLLFVTGIWGFISGEFIVSTVLFASAAIYSNMVKRTS